MNKFEVIVEILGKKYKCKIEALDKSDAWIQAHTLMCDKIKFVEANIITSEPIEEIVDFDNIFGGLFGKLGQR